MRETAESDPLGRNLWIIKDIRTTRWSESVALTISTLSLEALGGGHERECPVMQQHNHHDQAAGRDPDPAEPGIGPSGLLSGANGQPLDELSRAAGDEVFDILSGVQLQIERLRGLHRGHDEKLAALTARSREIETAGQEAAQQRAAVQQQQEALAEREHELATARRQHAATEAELDRQQAQFVEQQARGETDRAEPERRTRDLEQREAALSQQQAELSPERLDELLDRCQSLQDQLSAGESQITELGLELDRRAQQIDATDQQCREAEEQSQALQQQVAELQSTVAETNERAENLNREAESKLTALTDQVRELDATLEEQSASLEEFRQKNQAAEQENRRVSETLHEQEAQLEEGTKAKATVQDQLGAAENQIIDLKEELDRRAQQVNAKDQQCREAEEQSQSLQQQVAELQSTVAETNERAGSLNREAESKAAALTEQLEELEATVQERSASLDEYRDKFQTAQERIGDLADTLDEQQPRLEEGAEAIATVQQQRQQIGELTNQLAQYKVASDPDQSRQKDERIEELVEALRQARGQSPGEQSHAEAEARIHELTTENDQLRIEAERAAIETQEALRQLEQHDHAGSVDDGEDIVALHQQLEQLERKLAEARAVDLHPSRSGFDHPADGAGNEAQRLRVETQHLQRRRGRLARLRRALRARTRPDPLTGPETEVDSYDLQDQERQTQQLTELREMLAASEREMIRRWARPWAVVTLGWVAVLAVVVAGASWFFADHFAPATVSSSVTFEARNRSGAPLSIEEAESWRSWHTDLLVDTGFTNTLAKRLADRRLDRYGDPNALRQRFMVDLTIDAVPEGIMTVSLAGTDPQEITALLDALATTFVTESSRRMSKRGDGPHAVVKGGTKEGDRLRYATLNPIPIHDERLQYAGFAFGAAFPACLLLIWVIYRRLALAKSVFDDPDAMFIVPAV